MPTEVRHLVENGQPYPVVRLIGVLDRQSAEQVRSVLLTELAAQPEALVVDVHGLTLQDSAALAVLGEVARDNADWPSAHLVLCAAPGGRWQSSGLPVWPDPDQAVAALGPPEPADQLSARLEPVVGAARRARELVTEACGRWKLPELMGPGSIVVTEMVNNVVAHARTAMTVLLALRAGHLTVAVRDHSVATPRFTGPVPPTSYGGRGLLLIDSVARRWGNLLLADGKVVWAVLHADDETFSIAPGTAATVADLG